MILKQIGFNGNVIKRMAADEVNVYNECFSIIRDGKIKSYFSASMPATVLYFVVTCGKIKIKYVPDRLNNTWGVIMEE